MDIDPLYLLLYLRSDAGYAEIQRCIRGQTGHIYRQHVESVLIPKPAARFQEKTSAAIRALKESMKLRSIAANHDNEACDLTREIFSRAPHKPIIAR
jgi:hypothetical protein